MSKRDKLLCSAAAVALLGCDMLAAYNPAFVECSPAQLCSPTLAEPVDISEAFHLSPVGGGLTTIAQLNGTAGSMTNSRLTSIGGWHV
jgi:hypothetical protein